jgi:hypothetical protein
VSDRKSAAMPVIWPCRVPGMLLLLLLLQNSRVPWQHPLAATLQPGRRVDCRRGYWLFLHAGRKKCLVVVNSSASETRHASIKLDLELAGKQANDPISTDGRLAINMCCCSRCQQQLCMRQTITVWHSLQCCCPKFQR